MRVHGALGGAGGAGGVAEEREVAGCRIRPVRRGVAVARHGHQVLGPARERFRGRCPVREEAGVVAGLEVALVGGEDGPDAGLVRRPAQVRRPGAGLADQRDGARVAQDVPGLGGLVHRVQRDDHRPGLPGGQHAEHEVRGVLEHDGDPVAPPDPARHEVPGEGVGECVGLGVADAPVEVREGRAFGGARHGGPEGVQHGGRRADRRQLRRAQPAQPRPRGVRGAGRVRSAGPGRVGGRHEDSHFCWRWFMAPSHRSGSFARAAW